MSTTSKTNDQAVELPARPTNVPKNTTALLLKSEKHATVIRAAIKGVGKGVKVVKDNDTHWLFVPNTAAQATADAIGDFTSEHVYDTRLALATLVMLHNARPTVKVTKESATMRLVEGLQEKASSLKSFEWGVIVKLDGTLDFWTEQSGKRFEGRVSDVASKLKISTKKAA